MAILFFNQRYKHRVFDYKPMYYNQQKEELKDRIRLATLEYEKENDPSKYVSSIKGSMKNYITAKRKKDKISNIRLIIIMAVLFGIAYYILFT